MGFHAGEGLGRDGTGMKESIQVKQLAEGAGLGYTVTPVSSGIVSSPEDVQWFEHAESRAERELLSSGTQGKCVTHVTNSRFLSVDTLERLSEAEQCSTVIKLDDLAKRAESV